MRHTQFSAITRTQPTFKPFGTTPACALPIPPATSYRAVLVTADIVYPALSALRSPKRAQRTKMRIRATPMA